MLGRFIVSAALAASALAVPVAVAPASATVVSAPTAVAMAACTYRRVGQHWNCITPGAFCPKAARGKSGYAKVTSKRYRCTWKSADPYWRWRRA
ncbi:hypothetical protein HS048_34295 [Planomonospora sp. ID91781]|uniref:hypothetical protein n=1 Tax=Planomonospora sp. ID91781 TaxID=2738135 RepID=UPI0018C3C981|nr:hypothetical protein [Planomonospora sp. ID91781]MBG0825757.1 hypothetical protein [Planomonospora sp. ID91781]